MENYTRPLSNSFEKNVLPNSINSPETIHRETIQEWHEILSEFIIKVGLVETNRALETEMLVFPSAKRKQMSTHVEWLVQKLSACMSNIEADCSSNISKITGKRKIECGGDDKPAKRIQKIDTQQVQIRATHSEIEQRIEAFMQQKKSEINDSNRSEFLRKSHDPNDNEAIPLNVYERLRVLEAKIMQLEIDHPPWAAVHFNQPNLQYATPPPMTNIIRNENNEIVLSMTNDSSKNSQSPNSLNLSSTVSIQSSPKIDIKKSSSSQKLKQVSDTIQLKGRANSSLTRSIIQQLEQAKKMKQPESVSEKERELASQYSSEHINNISTTPSSTNPAMTPPIITTNGSQNIEASSINKKNIQETLPSVFSSMEIASTSNKQNNKLSKINPADKESAIHQINSHTSNSFLKTNNELQSMTSSTINLSP
ncbi:3555_t:CDS:2 [Ambispora gerdemannii]|uniref:3555_t:CDS:1 n=1 Tax=Ambispora gerdemannii TaxID=144530 RepID=A0A9N9B3S2_9GLOM|nr:3555_t:CDS:2 [Ambispora gerdemannii]